jgi:virulence-associated protein E
LFYEANEADPSWRARAVATMGFPDVTEKGGLRPSLPNTKVALVKLGVECRHDLFKLRYLVNGLELESFVGDMSDPALLWLREIIYERFNFDPSTSTVHTAVMTLANHHRFHPVRDYLDGLTWDGTPRIDQWLSTYGEADDNDYTRAVGTLVLMAAVRRVREPGCKFDEMLVLENPEQGTNKSQALQMLAVKPEWFSDNLPLGLQPKETIEALSGHWIMEVSELQGMRKSEIEKVKAFASRGTDRARMAYDRTVTEARRQCVIIGTTNSEQYLRDLTGNRRFWPVRVGWFDLEGLERDRDQLWAEAAAREASGASIRLPEELWPAATAELAERVIENPFVSALEHALREKDDRGGTMRGKIAAEDVWILLQVRPAQRSQQQFELLGDAMKQLGWERTRLRTGGGDRAYHYVHGPEPHRRINVVIVDGQANAYYEDELKQDGQERDRKATRHRDDD